MVTISQKSSLSISFDSQALLTEAFYYEGVDKTIAQALHA